MVRRPNYTIPEVHEISNIGETCISHSNKYNNHRRGLGVISSTRDPWLIYGVGCNPDWTNYMVGWFLPNLIIVIIMMMIIMVMIMMMMVYLTWQS